MTHVHPCCHCKTPVECQGKPTLNGCDLYHQSDRLCLCESCDKAFLPLDCHDCGQPAAVVFEDRDDASGYRGEEGLCMACLAQREARA